MDLKETKKQLMQWLWEGKYANKYTEEDCIIITYNAVHLRLFTDINEYKIVAIPKGKDYEGYLGCTGRSRKPRAGETWTRGNDLSDGNFCYETWVEILSGIVGYELVKIHTLFRDEKVDEKVVEAKK